jgi:GNAT superfamily N-acetyltransferase
MIRKGGQQDVPFLRAMLRHAYHWHVNQLDDSDIPISRYVEGWGRAGDTAVVALEGGHPIGAAWFRLFAADAPGLGFVDEQTPELSIAVVPARREHGVGTELLDALVARARDAGHRRLSLSVQKASPAVGFYERHGFATHDERGDAFTMVATLDPA